MNELLKNYYPLFEYYQALRSQLVELLLDDDLSFSPGGENQTLGQLCREIGETQKSYIDSFKTLTLDFNYRSDNPHLETNVAALHTWFVDLDAQLRSVIAGFDDRDLEEKKVDRGHDFIIPIRMNLEIYKEALLLFYGKVSVYLKLLGKERPEQWREWIG